MKVLNLTSEFHEWVVFKNQEIESRKTSLFMTKAYLDEINLKLVSD